MTFKHNDFGSSELMRSLERVALERGLIKPEDPITKQASAPKPDFEPTPNLMENIFKLCAGLREQNLIKEALELEMNYLNYKQAQTLYEVSKETGEDVLEMAHPEGSHTLKNVEGDEAVIEDLLDKHVKIMQVMDKKPTGKLSTAQILSEVKKALAQKMGPNEIMAQIRSYVAESQRMLKVVIDAANEELTFSQTSKYEKFVKLTNDYPTVYRLTEALELVDALQTRLNPSFWAGWGVGGISENTFVERGVQHNLAQIAGNMKDCIELRKWYDNLVPLGSAAPAGEPASPRSPSPASPSTTTGPFAPMFARLNELTTKVLSWQSIRSVSTNPVAKKWVTAELSALEDIHSRYSTPAAIAGAANLVQSLQQEIDTEAADINKFETWLKSAR